MQKRYYIDTCIWIDYFENRKDRFRPLGEWAILLINKIIANEDIILYSNLTLEELSTVHRHFKAEMLFEIVPAELLIKIIVSGPELQEAIKRARLLHTPLKDTIHAIVARDNKAILVTRDKHFLLIEIDVEIKRPEELI